MQLKKSQRLHRIGQLLIKQLGLSPQTFLNILKMGKNLRAKTFYLYLVDKDVQLHTVDLKLLQHCQLLIFFAFYNHVFSLSYATIPVYAVLISLKNLEV